MTIDVAAALKGAVRVGMRVVLWLALAIVLWVGGNVARIALIEVQPPQQAAPGGGRWIQAHDTMLHVVEHGDAQSPPLLLVAGTGAWAGTWRDSVGALVRAGWRVIAVDLPPFGFSQRPAGGDYSRGAQAQRLLGLIASLGDAPIVLVGHSYGGGPAAEAAMLKPDRIRHLVLIDAAIGLRSADAPPCVPPGPLSRLFTWSPLRTGLVAASGTQPLLTGFWLRQFVSRTDTIDDDRVAIYRLPLPVRGTSNAIGAWASQFAAECGRARSEHASNFATLRPPLTLLWGELDTITPLPQAQAIVAAQPRARLVRLAGVGHIPQIEDPPAFNAQLSAALNDLPRQPAP
jgi:pimeloyl-ACP methyl ester carboxylesterase